MKELIFDVIVIALLNFGVSIVEKDPKNNTVVSPIHSEHIVGYVPDTVKAD